VIGVDMTRAMVEKARSNAKSGGFDNVEFREGLIEELPVESGSVDAVISNCVINLSPEKHRVFAEAYRVLRPGGRLMISDVVLERPLPQALLESAAAYVACIGGAELRERYLDTIREAGFRDVEVVGEAGFAAAYPDDIESVDDPRAASLLAGLGIEVSEAKRMLDGLGLGFDAVRDALAGVTSLKVRAMR
jgi:SAM-dependent methyltransferase